MCAMLTAWINSAPGQWQPAFDAKLPERDRGSVAVAPVGEALTFARSRGILYGVTRYEDGSIEGVDLTSLFGSDDAIRVVGERGYDAIAAAVASAAPENVRRVSVGDLERPIDATARNIALGTNYPEHAKDAGTTRPFLFPKIVEPGRSGDEVSVRGGLLDYEVEIAVVPLQPLAPGETPALLGLVLANDFTDRETLMQVVDRSDIESGVGFTTGKSFPGYLPIGDLFVVPRDWSSFVPTLDLRLYVDGRLRQHSAASEMVWDTARMLGEIHARKGTTWEHRGERYALFDGDAIPAGTLILSGTPHGTVFDGMPWRAMAAGVLRWLGGGWDRSVPEQVIAAYADAAREAKAYLQPGQEVRIVVPKLGQLRSKVVR
jgi:2,4-diketo-3-deoxy-L-fuconate hydrolase